MPRYRLTIEYDGGPFVGWQRQANGRSVQEAIEQALVRLTGEEITIRGAGRTDAGVHALGQVAHLDLGRDWPTDTLRDGLNAHLRPEPVAIIAAEQAAPDFDARHSAVQRHYRYRIVNRRAPLALDRGRAWQFARKLDAGGDGARRQKLLLGTARFHDVPQHRMPGQKPGAHARPARRDARGDDIFVEASARSFLHNQVRSMVGSLKLVGEGKWSADDLKHALDARDRKACGPVAPPEGLYLVRVDYPPGP